MDDGLLSAMLLQPPYFPHLRILFRPVGILNPPSLTVWSVVRAPVMNWGSPEFEPWSSHFMYFSTSKHTHITSIYTQKDRQRDA